MNAVAGSVMSGGIAESSAFLAYFADGTQFLPSERYDRAKVMQRLSFEQYYIEPTIGSLRFWTLPGRLEPTLDVWPKTRNGERCYLPLGKVRLGALGGGGCSRNAKLAFCKHFVIQLPYSRPRGSGDDRLGRLSGSQRNVLLLFNC